MGNHEEKGHYPIQSHKRLLHQQISATPFTQE